MSSIKRILSVLEREPEIWLSYFRGQHGLIRYNVQEQNSRYRSVMLRIFMFFYRLARLSPVIQKQEKLSIRRILIFAGTANQLSSLESTAHKLVKTKEEKILALTLSNIRTPVHKNDGWVVLKWDWTVIFRAVHVLAKRKPQLKRQLENIEPNLSVSSFYSFTMVYAWLAYFDSLLDQIQPAYVVMSNDHNVPNRCLLALARFRGIDTVYLQHASVSHLFPALDFKYAFLDGMAALQIYQGCEGNRSATSSSPMHRHVFLSGNKKRLYFSTGLRKCVGVAVNSLDKISNIKALTDALSTAGYAIRLRWHPATSLEQRHELEELAANNAKVLVRSPNEETISDYCRHIFCMIAANSSVHLESAICGVVPVYFALGEVTLSDYYGYVKHGLSYPADNEDEVLELVEKIEARKISLNIDAVQFYSATYRTEWQGREDELVASHLLKLLEGIEPRTLWGYEQFETQEAEVSNNQQIDPPI